MRILFAPALMVQFGTIWLWFAKQSKIIHSWNNTTQYIAVMHTTPWIQRQINGMMALQWRHNGGDIASNHQPQDSLLNRWFRRRSKITSKLRVTGLCAGNSPGTGEFPAQMASNAENFPFDDVIMGKTLKWQLAFHISPSWAIFVPSIVSPLGRHYHKYRSPYRWFSARLQYLQCVSNGDTAVLL